mmetsp:Transcript_25433/g.26499  ORF Transcript_25433/g.26499 Transcript_25433/m.26499 type:complete len:218 (-) Transcript_25433:46-699(-)
MNKQDNLTVSKLPLITTAVPADPHASLAYYLKCVSSCLGNVFHNQPVTYYENHHSFSSETKKEIVRLAELFNPDLLIRSNVFMVDNRIQDLEYVEFCRVSLLNDRTEPGESKDGHLTLKVGGTEYQVSSTMKYKDPFLERYYSSLKNIHGKKSSWVYIFLAIFLPLIFPFAGFYIIWNLQRTNTDLKEKRMLLTIATVSFIIGKILWLLLLILVVWG